LFAHIYNLARLHVVFSEVFPVSNTWTLDIVSHVEPTHVIIIFCLSNFADNPGLSTWLYLCIWCVD